MCQLCNLVNLANRSSKGYGSPPTISTWGALSSVALTPVANIQPSTNHNSQVSTSPGGEQP